MGKILQISRMTPLKFRNSTLRLLGTILALINNKTVWIQGVRVKMIAAGAEHTASVTEDGDLYGWGWGRYGNLGLGDRDDRLIPEKVSSVNVSNLTLGCL